MSKMKETIDLDAQRAAEQKANQPPTERKPACIHDTE